MALPLSARKTTSQRYVVLTNHTIADTSTVEYSVGRVTGYEWKWLDPQGTYGKAPYSIEPQTNYGYVRDLVLARAAKTLDAYRATSSPLFEDFLINDVYALALTRSSDGIWRTNYTSTWVKGESGITAPFIDTRNNEALAMHLLKITSELDAHGNTAVAPARGWALPFARYLQGRSAAGAVARTGTGAFFGDYYDNRGTLRTHTSLNHALGEMNYLLTLYLETGDPSLLDTALRTKAAVDDTSGQWIRANHDLWYQRNIRGTYSGTDYPTVTYYDLLFSQQLFTKILGAPDPVFAALIQAKSDYLGVPYRSVSVLGAESPAAAAPLVIPEDRVELP